MHNNLVKLVIKLLSVDSQYTKEEDRHRFEIVWRNVMVLAYLHGAAVYGLLLTLGGYAKTQTLIWSIFLAVTSSTAVTGGAHRLWAHRCYKANLPMRIILATFFTMTFQNHIYEWARDHRVHHKFAETNADPHNAKRGFFFSHVGWLMVKKHPDVLTKGKTVDMSDLEKDKVVVFQRKFYPILVVLLTFVMPTVVPYHFWGEDIWVSWYVAGVFRYVLAVNLVWCINSAAHLYGPRPYDKTIGPTQNPTMMRIGLGEGFHNYHHTFPWDYKASEFGNDWRNITTFMIEAFASIGWAWDLKTTSKEMVIKRALRTGDGTYEANVELLKKHFVDKEAVTGEEDKEMIWGWGDKAMDAGEMKSVVITNARSDAA